MGKNRIYISSKDVDKLDEALLNRDDIHICLINEDKLMEKRTKE